LSQIKIDVFGLKFGPYTSIYVDSNVSYKYRTGWSIYITKLEKYNKGNTFHRGAYVVKVMISKVFVNEVS